MATGQPRNVPCAIPASSAHLIFTLLQASLAAKERLAATQQQTIQRLEATVSEQRADITAALALVSGRPPAGAMLEEDPLLAGEEAGHASGGGDGASAYSGWEEGAVLGCASVGGGWEAAADAAPLADAAAWASDGGEGGQYGIDQLNSLLHAATTAADAAAAWAGGYGDAWGSPAEAAADWSIAAVGGGERWAAPGGERASRSGSPAKGRAGIASPGKRASPSKKPLHAAAANSPAAAPGLAAVEADIAGLEAALRSALGDLSV